MSHSTCGLFAHVQSYFTDYLPKQRGASVHTVRAYRDALTMLFKFIAEQHRRGVLVVARQHVIWRHNSVFDDGAFEFDAGAWAGKAVSS